MEFKDTALVGVVLNAVDGGTSYSKYYYAAYGNNEERTRSGAGK
jgi:hypothetical protein